MRLKELTLQGYKSFATKHRFEFPSVVTAVVGPNGSGKSNIADAVRWVLGEQRSSHLRAKRTDELIFAGTERRPRSGLAEVNLTLDNADEWLPIEFPEVVLTRRAHRDGTNEYLINGSRVRLRDLLDLVEGRLGRSTYTVIGQGLVDNALALRPEDRRGLIDEAAGIVPLQRKRDSCLRQLAETDENLTRVNDILAELEPQLRRLGRLNKRVERYRGLMDEVEELLEAWYSRRLHDLHRATLAREAEVGECRAAVEDARATSAEARRAYDETQIALDEAESALGSRRAERERQAAAAATAERAAAVAAARLEGVAARLEELTVERASLDSAEEGARQRIGDLERDRSHLRDTLDEAVERLARLQTDAAGIDESASSLEERVEEARRSLFDRATELADSRNRITMLRDRRQRLQREYDTAAAGVDSAAAEIESIAAELSTANQTLGDAQSEVDRLAGDHEEALRSRHEIDRSLTETGTQAARAAARLLALQEQIRAASRSAPEAGTTAEDLREALGPRALGLVAELLEPEAEWDKAAAAALGELAHGIVVDSIDSLDAALEVLAAEPGEQPEERLALVPNTGQGPAKRWVPAPGELPAESVLKAPSLPSLPAVLLGSTAFVSNLAAAREAVARSDGPARAVAKSGELVYRGGLVVVGQSGGPLRAQAKRSRLDEEERQLADELSRLREREEAIADRQAESAAQVAELEQQLRESRQRKAEAQDAASRLTLAQDRERDSQELFVASRERLQSDIAAVERDLEVAEDAAAAAESEQRTSEEAVERLLEELRRVRALSARSGHAEATRAEAEASRALAACEARIESARNDIDQLATRRAQAEARFSELEATAAELQSELDEKRSAAALAQDALAAIDTDLAPIAESVMAARRRLRSAADALEESRRSLSELDDRLATARVDAARAEDAFSRLRDQLLSDATWLPPAATLADRLESTDLTTWSVPDPAELPADLDERLTAAKQGLRRIGPVDEEALAEQQHVAGRHAHLTEQRADLEAAMKDLRSVLEQLETEMDSRFRATFESVADAFAEFFPRLFGGGEARLVVTEAEDGSGGVDIVARPPGKRSQPLQLLSGGERAITAVALIFALLQASGTPFVVLDEVDAALDEANVDRFCRALDELATSTQVVIITHNRGTIQHAGSVYGVTMADDGASQVISLRVDEVA